jgi:hypothetical protein
VRHTGALVGAIGAGPSGLARGRSVLDAHVRIVAMDEKSLSPARFDHPPARAFGFRASWRKVWTAVSKRASWSRFQALGMPGTI